MNGLFSFRIPTKTVYSFYSSLILAICPAHLFLLGFFILILLDVRYKSRWSSSVCGFLHYLIISSLVGSYFFLSALLSGTVCLCFFLNENDIRQNCNSVYLNGDILTLKNGTQEIMDRTVEGFPEHNLFLSLHTLFWYGYCRSQTFELCHIFKGFIISRCLWLCPAFSCREIKKLYSKINT